MSHEEEFHFNKKQKEIRPPVEIRNGVAFYLIGEITRTLSENQYITDKPFFDKHGFEGESDYEMAVLMLASTWKKDLAKSIELGDLEYYILGRRQGSRELNEDGRIKEPDINKWLKDEGHTFLFKSPQIKPTQPTTEEDNYFQSLTSNSQDQVSLITKVITELGIQNIGNGEKKEIHQECSNREPHLITASYGTFQRTWVKAKKSGRTPK